MDMQDFATRKDEPLHRALVPYLHDSKFLGKVLQHPLVYAIPYIPQLAWQQNDQYKYKKEAVRLACDQANWGSYIWLHERAYRREAFVAISKHLTGPEYWALLREIYQDSENLFQWGPVLGRLMRSRKPGREHFMDEEEREFLANLPDTVEIHRGYQEPDGIRDGWSWTLDKEKAGWFSQRLLHDGDKPVVVSRVIAKSKLFAYLASRGEEEIVVDPRYL